jgi:hypothetical protein
MEYASLVIADNAKSKDPCCREVTSDAGELLIHYETEKCSVGHSTLTRPFALKSCSKLE